MNAYSNLYTETKSKQYPCQCLKVAHALATGRQQSAQAPANEPISTELAQLLTISPQVTQANAIIAYFIVLTVMIQSINTALASKGKEVIE